jgi:hypothetical protein
MKFTQYFVHMRERPDRRGIRIEWIERTINIPEHEQIQADGRVRRWKRIGEAENRWLRVILLEDRETVHNAFFDRSFRGTEHEG